VGRQGEVGRGARDAPGKSAGLRARRGETAKTHRIPLAILQRSRDFRHPMTPTEAKIWQALCRLASTDMDRQTGSEPYLLNPSPKRLPNARSNPLSWIAEWRENGVGIGGLRRELPPRTPNNHVCAIALGGIRNCRSQLDCARPERAARVHFQPVRQGRPPMSFPSKGYQRHVRSALDTAYRDAQARARSFDVREDRLVVFSDQHKGVRDKADDFRGAQSPYHAALGYYFEKGYTLGMLGDAEELWEDDPGPVLEKYRATLNLEKAFHEHRQRYWRIWGNHDDDWRYKAVVTKHLRPVFPELEVHESLLLIACQDDKEIGRFLLVHGHQGTLEGDRLGGFMKFVVRYFWRPLQRRTGINLNTPSKDWRLRMRQNIALYNWAVEQEGLVLIAGHTHHPVFFQRETIDDLEHALEKARNKGDPDEIARGRASLEFARVRESTRGFMMDQPCYFNSGCCCFADGDITGLEVDSGMIRLVRWPDDRGKPQPTCLTEMKLKDVFREVAEKGNPLEPPRE